MNIMDEGHGIQAVVFYVDIESGGNVSNLGLNVGERGRVALWISRSGGFPMLAILASRGPHLIRRLCPSTRAGSSPPINPKSRR